MTHPIRHLEYYRLYSKGWYGFYECKNSTNQRGQLLPNGTSAVMLTRKEALTQYRVMLLSNSGISYVNGLRLVETNLLTGIRTILKEQ